MLNLKKTAVAVLAFGSSAVFAGSMGPVCTPGNVTVPCASTAWDFGAQALYLKPSYSGYQYNGSTTTGLNAQGGITAGSTVTETYNKTPYNWGWGFQIEGSYHFSTGNDLNLNWYHLDHTANRSFAGVDGFDVLNVGIGTDSYTGIASAQTRWDAVNLEFGQMSHFGEWKNIRFHGGVQYARIQSTADIDVVNRLTLAGAVAVPGFVADAEATLKYSGFGPRIGADYAYNWGNGFAMYAKGASALLVGSQSFNNVHSYSTATIATTTGVVTGSATAIVPELEAKLGLTYTYAMAQGDLSLDAGWMWVNYFNALNNGFDSAGTDSGLFASHDSNFAVQGPFIGLKWVGNVA